ncbi:uncharacterized protein F5Z01DRAFT_643037 [Emericellopsis atlantica]|uniref:LITAF domain-containing protein n=1 Tax=Emericellopsis atlantica TaxID=2614577 RepID=A0A9P8CSQ7_9HYPO|nr:uncharacterized protein F5Z01DRAFT_643037 [Emericellopsis atlantica]KAG9258344.1 hypothetical protein F5Z01DRAFT_643037 [Emericellopsis atlantica]
MRTAASDAPMGSNPLRQLTYKRAQFVTCPACRHGGTTVLAKERLAGWRYAACTGVIILFAPLTLGTTLIMFPFLLRPQFVTHSCRRCGLRLAIATSGVGECQYTIPVDVEDDNFVPAPDDWRPDLARLPSGLRVARSPLGPRPEISEREMKVCNKRFINTHPRARLTLLATDSSGSPIRCMLEGSVRGGDQQPSSSRQYDAEVLYEIHASGIDALDSRYAQDACIKVMMRPPPQDAVAEDLPSYTKQPIDAGKKTPASQQEPTGVASMSAQTPQPFTEACRVSLFSTSKSKYSSAMYLPTQATSDSAPSHMPGRRETVYINAVPAHQRAQFSGGMPIWRWQSSQGGLLWVSRRFRDAEMAGIETKLCLVDDYDRLVAVLDRWDGLRFSSPADDLYRGGGLGRKSVLTLYADLGAALLGEVLGSLCTLAVQVKRVTTEMKKEQDERRQNAY